MWIVAHILCTPLADRDVCISVALVGMRRNMTVKCVDLYVSVAVENVSLPGVYEYECGLRGLDCDCGASMDWSFSWIVIHPGM